MTRGAGGQTGGGRAETGEGGEGGEQPRGGQRARALYVLRLCLRAHRGSGRAPPTATSSSPRRGYVAGGGAFSGHPPPAPPGSLPAPSPRGSGAARTRSVSTGGVPLCSRAALRGCRMAGSRGSRLPSGQVVWGGGEGEGAAPPHACPPRRRRRRRPPPPPLAAAAACLGGLYATLGVAADAAAVVATPTATGAAVIATAVTAAAAVAAAPRLAQTGRPLVRSTGRVSTLGVRFFGGRSERLPVRGVEGGEGRGSWSCFSVAYYSLKGGARLGEPSPAAVGVCSSLHLAPASPLSRS